MFECSQKPLNFLNQNMVLHCKSKYNFIKEHIHVLWIQWCLNKFYLQNYWTVLVQIVHGWWMDSPLERSCRSETEDGGHSVIRQSLILQPCNRENVELFLKNEQLVWI